MFPRVSLLLLGAFFINISFEWEIIRKVQDGKKTITVDGQKKTIMVKKVFITLVDGGYTYRKKKVTGTREMGVYRVQFVCIECSRLGLFLGAYCSVSVEDPKKRMYMKRAICQILKIMLVALMVWNILLKVLRRPFEMEFIKILSVPYQSFLKQQG